MSSNEKLSVRLALVQSAGLRSVAALLDCPTYVEMLLVPRHGPAEKAPTSLVGDSAKDGADKIDGPEKSESAGVGNAETADVRAAVRELVMDLVTVTASKNPFEKPVDVVCVQRCHNLLHGACTRVCAEDSYCISHTQERVMALAHAVGSTATCSAPLQKESYERPQSLFLEPAELPGSLGRSHSPPLDSGSRTTTNSAPTRTLSHSASENGATSRFLSLPHPSVLGVGQDGGGVGGAIDRNPILPAVPPHGDEHHRRFTTLNQAQLNLLASVSAAAASSSAQHRTSYDGAAVTASAGAAGFTTVTSYTPKSAPASAGATGLTTPSLGSDERTGRGDMSVPGSRLPSSSPSPPSTPQTGPEGAAGSSNPTARPAILPQLLEMGFSLRHIQAAITALGTKTEASGRHLNQLVTWLLENPPLPPPPSSVPVTEATHPPHPATNGRRRSNDDALTLFANQMCDTSRENVDLSGRRRAFMRRTGCVDIRSFMIPSRAAGRSSLEQRDREQGRPYHMSRGEAIRHNLRQAMLEGRAAAINTLTSAPAAHYHQATTRS